jgi:hypothetical protein
MARQRVSRIAVDPRVLEHYGTKYPNNYSCRISERALHYDYEPESKDVSVVLPYF